MIATVRAVGFLCLWLVVYQVKGSYIPAEMNRTIQNLLHHYVSTDCATAAIPQALVFSPVEKMVYMSSVLDMYEKMFGHMLKQLPTPSPKLAASTGRQAAAGSASDAPTGAGEDVRKQLTYILKKVQDLKRHHYQKQDQFLQKLYSVRHIQIDNFVIQNKALWELPGLYQQASALPDNGVMRRRRRRQAQRKTQLRV
uniref:Interferon gamma n=1 Tax=Mola mola TaxID=94237 RepID=A0A3Q4AT56_MOLML